MASSQESKLEWIKSLIAELQDLRQKSTISCQNSKPTPLDTIGRVGINSYCLTKSNLDEITSLLDNNQVLPTILYLSEHFSEDELARFAGKNCIFIKIDESSASIARGLHPRLMGLFPQYTGTQVGLGENLTLSVVVDENTKLKDWKGEAHKASYRYGSMTSEEYSSSHNHTQALLVEGWNFSRDINLIAIWGDSLAAGVGSKVWGGFLSARSHYLTDWHPFTPRDQEEDRNPNDKFDAQLIGLEIDVLNGGLDSGSRINDDSPPLAKNGLQVVGFGKRNSAAIEVRCEDTDDQTRTPSDRRGAWDYIFIARNAVHDRSTFVCSGFSKGFRGIDLGNTLFSDGAVRIKSNQPDNGILFNSGSSKIYEKDGILILESKSGLVNMIKSGSAITGSARSVIEAYRCAHSMQNISKFALLYSGLNISYSYIPKNACTTIKTSLGVADGSIAKGCSPHGLEGQYITRSLITHGSARKIIALRNPFRRVVSAYLDKICKPFEDFGREVCTAVLVNQRGLAIDHVNYVLSESKLPTFREFVNYLFCRSDFELNEHFRSQCSFFTFEDYDEILPVEALSKIWLQSSLKEIPLIDSRPHATALDKQVLTDATDRYGSMDVADVFGSILRQSLEVEGVVPSVDLFFCDDVILRRFSRRFADDIYVYSELFPGLAGDNLYLRGLSAIL